METHFAIISDLHCHHSSSAPAESLLITDSPRFPSTQHPVEALLELVEHQELKADVLLMPGDLANKADPQGMHSGWSYLREISTKLRATHIIATLGNHDVASRQMTNDPFGVVRGLSPRFPTSSQLTHDQFWSNGFSITEGESWRVLSFNSVWNHTNERTAEHGTISQLQIESIEAAVRTLSAKPVLVAICHHHPILHEDIGSGSADVMENGSLLASKLSELGFSLLVHGHKHHPKLSSFTGAQSLPILAAGSFSAGLKGNLASRTRNVFHIVTFESSEKNGSLARGTVRTWEFQAYKGWVDATWSSAGFPSKTGFGSTATPEELCQKISEVFLKSGEGILRWEEITKAVPDLKFIPPHLFAEVGKRLVTSGVNLQPSPPDSPQYIGRNSQ